MHIIKSNTYLNMNMNNDSKRKSLDIEATPVLEATVEFKE